MSELEKKPLREWRNSRWLTQEELGAKMGEDGGVKVSGLTVSAWELGIKRPRAKNMRNLAKALGVLPEQIILPEEGKDAATKAA